MEAKELVARALDKNGRVYGGANVECAAFGAGLCAERAAVASAAADGCLDFEALAVAGNGEEFCVPCGICRQLLWEFAPELPVFCANERGDFKKIPLKELLPHAFGDFRPEKQGE